VEDGRANTDVHVRIQKARGSFSKPVMGKLFLGAGQKKKKKILAGHNDLL